LKVLVTGGAGFIGSNLTRSILERGDDVRILDDFSTGRRSNLENLPGDFELLEGDVRDPSACAAACEGVECVLHQAALGSVPRSIEDPLKTHLVNVDGTLNLLLAARDRQVRRFVYASSSSVYGDAPEPVKTETLPPRPLSPYAISKLAAEQYTIVFSRLGYLEGVALRYFNVFGPCQDPDSMYAAVVPRFASALLRGESPTIYGDGGQSRDFTHVDNVVRANLLAMACPAKSCGRAYNVACGRATSVNDLFRLLREGVGPSAAAIEPVYAPPRKGDVRDSLASIEAAAAGLSYEQVVDLRDGIRSTVEWYRARAESR
jgi:nucleoside-diphosphate-sugar epimerase